MIRFSPNDESGLTLVEILIALSLLMIGLVAVMQAFPLATQGMDIGRRQSTAEFLAEQKIEEIKAWALAASPKGFDNMPICNPCTGAAPFNLEGFNSIQGYGDYARTVVVQNGPSPTGNSRLVRVTASYRQATGATQVSVETLIGKR